MEYKDVKDSSSTKISKSTRDNHVWNLVCRSGFISHKDTPASTCKWIRNYVYEYVYARQLFQITIRAGIDIIDMIKCAKCGERKVKELYANITNHNKLYCMWCISKFHGYEWCRSRNCHKFGSRSNMFAVGSTEYSRDMDKFYHYEYYYCSKSCYTRKEDHNCPYCHKKVTRRFMGLPCYHIKCDCGIFCERCDMSVNICRNKGPKREEGKEFFECKCGVYCGWCGGEWYGDKCVPPDKIGSIIFCGCLYCNNCNTIPIKWKMKGPEREKGHEFFECKCGVTCIHCKSCTPLNKLDNLSCKCFPICEDCKTIIKYDSYRYLEFCDCRDICPYCKTDVYEWDEGPELHDKKQYIACDCSVKCRYCGDRRQWKYGFNVLSCKCYPVCTDCDSQYEYVVQNHGNSCNCNYVCEICDTVGIFGSCECYDSD